MLIIENLFLAFSGLKTNKMRALLTMLGIIIGISAVIAIVSIGDSISASFEKSMKEMGMENISVDVRQRSNGEDGMDMYYGGDEKKPEESDLLSLPQVNGFQQQFSSQLSAVSLSKDVGSAEIRIGRKSEGVSLQGTNEGYSFLKKVKIVEGRYIEDRDIIRMRKVAVIPQSMAGELEKENSRDAVVGREIKVTAEDGLYNFTIIGVYDDSKKGQMPSYTNRASVYIPMTTAGDIKGQLNYQSMEITPAFGINSAELTSEINAYFEKVYVGNKDWQVSAYNMKEGMDSYAQTMAQTKLAIAVIAGISLLVGGIGVMNIMLVSVTERTREIGVRKALGAKDRFIKLQFIVEAIIICGIGGIIGVALGLIISAAAASMMNNPFVISIPIILISVAFSMTIGVFFGYYPANKAAALDPIDALRYE